MRTFYVFNINDYFFSMYRETPYRIYEMLEDIYHIKNYDLRMTVRLYSQMVCKINKVMMNEYLYNNYNMYQDYNRECNTHNIATNYEYSKLIVSNTHLKIRTNRNYPVFFECLNRYNNNIFVCDFENKDYFWLDKIASQNIYKSKITT